MAFDNVTLFEVHLDDAKLSSIFGGADADEEHRDDEMVVEAASEDEMTEEMDAETMDEEMGDEDAMDEDGMDEDAVVPSRGRGFVRFVAVAAVVGIAYAVLRRRRGGDATDEDEAAHVEMADDVEHVEIDEAAPQ